MMRAILFIALIVSTAMASRATAQQVIHRVGFGETLLNIAKHYYGGETWAYLIARVNGRENARLDERLAAGERIAVPTAWIYIAPKLTTLRAVASLYLGDSRREATLRHFNPRLRGKVRAGEKILIPVVISHVVKTAETVRDIAKRYYGNPDDAAVISHFNALTNTVPAAGTELKVPLAHIQILARRWDELVQQRILGIGDSSATQQEALQEVNAMLRRGEYWQVPLQVARVLSEHDLNRSQMGEVFRLLAVAYVALGQHDLAVRAFREALLRRPDIEMDPVTVSPTVIKAFLDAKEKNR